MRPRPSDRSIFAPLAGIALAVLCLLPSAVQAAEDWYQVEVIVFRYTHPETTEKFADISAALPDFSNALRLQADAGLRDAADALASRDQPQAYRALSRGELGAAGVSQRLSRAGGYEVLLHAGWRQPGADARAVFLSSEPAGAAPLPGSVTPHQTGVEGSVRVRGHRPLVVDLDLVSYESGTPIRITASRNLKLRELTYIDHPLVGVLIQVSPYQSPELNPASAVAPAAEIVRP